MQSTMSGTVLKKCIDKQQRIQNSIRAKSVFQWYNQIMKKFDEPKVIKPPYNHCVQIGKHRSNDEFLLQERQLLQCIRQTFGKILRKINKLNYFIAGDPVLRQKAPEVSLDKIKSDEIQNLIKQMKKVQRAYNLVGIAAPQIGVSYRIICIESPEDLKDKYPTAVYKTRQMDILPMTVSVEWFI